MAGLLLDQRWDAVPRLDLSAVLHRCPQVVLIANSLWDGQAAIGATLADIVRDGAAVSVTRSLESLDDHTLVIAPASPSTRAAALDSGSILLEYAPGQANSEPPWSRLRMLAPTLAGLQDKRRLLRELDTAAVWEDCVAEALVIPDHPELAARVETFVMASRRRSDVAPQFDAMLDDGGDDPWRLDTSPYERRRLELILACLGRPHYSTVLEIGCSTGQLTEALAKRADEVIAMDASPKALAVAEGRAGSDGVRWVLGAAPADLPDVDADLVLLSEVGYFLDGPDLLSTLRAARHRLRPDGEIVVANWRRPTERIPLDGTTVQAQAVAMMDLPRRAHYEDADLFVDVWGAPVSVYDEYAEPPPPCG